MFPFLFEALAAAASGRAFVWVAGLGLWVAALVFGLSSSWGLAGLFFVLGAIVVWFAASAKAREGD